ncbi:hypothetical protein [uncultured Phascolarctobacterium sp.]|uniref:hypothetical protein n=1 Tax=uncultured Phascolarctobacterium sp. TaxID=512296 RepID=UPI0025E6D84B|nr:hypothetical protein [uncultured Phascolarctobacterium sp.]
MSKENIQKIASELRKQGCRFLLCGTDEQKKPFYEFYGGTPEGAIKLHFEIIALMCLHMRLSGADDKVLREYLEEAIKTSGEVWEAAKAKTLM